MICSLDIVRSILHPAFLSCMNSYVLSNNLGVQLGRNTGHVFVFLPIFFFLVNRLKNTDNILVRHISRHYYEIQVLQ